VIPTPKPEPTPTPKWVPEHLATDGNLIIGNLVEEDSINVLILGIDRSAYLADTIGVVSISVEKQTVSLVMFPRDTYIAYASDVMSNIKKIRHDNLPGEYKLNNVYNVSKNTEKYSTETYNDNRFGNQHYDFLAQVTYEKFDILVDDFVQINTYGLVRLVDTFGGVRVYVPLTMRYHDPDQKLNINLSKGSQVLNGTQAEGFVRFRQGYDSKGNLSIQVDRTENQIAFMKAFYEQHAKLSNIGKIPDIISILKKNIVHSLSMDDIFTKYVDILTLVVREKYEMESVKFDTVNVKKLNSVYTNIKGVIPPPTPKP
jgi:LCP family protein required for cell wall assembly